MLTEGQKMALRAIGKEIGEGWVRAANGALSLVDVNYNFENSADWMAVRSTAWLWGIDWADKAQQPAASIQAEVWAEVGKGYRMAMIAAGLVSR